MVSAGIISRRRALHRGIIAAALAACVMLGWLSPVRGQAVVDAPLVDWSHAQRVYRHVESWVHAGEAPQREFEESIQAADVHGVRVTLRWLGMTVGTGTAVPADIGVEDGGAVDLLVLSRLATVRAMVELNIRLDSPGDGGARLREVAPRLLVDLQVAHGPRPIALARDAAAEAIYQQFSPGYHGLRMTAESGASAMLWPASALAGNLPPRNQLTQLLAEVGLSFDQLPQVGRPGGPSLQRFEAIHMVRPLREMPVQRLTRGQQVLPGVSLDSRTLEAMAERMAEHLIRKHRADRSMAGTYRPSPDRYEPETAADDEHAFAAYALARWMDAFAHTIDDQTRLRTVAAVEQTVDRMAQRVLLGQDQQSPSGAALALLTAMQLPAAEQRQLQINELAGYLTSVQNNDGSFRTAVREVTLLPLSGQALCAAALTRFLQHTSDARVATPVARADAWLWRQSAVWDLATLPWLAMIHQDLAQATLPRVEGRPTPEQRRQALRQATDQLLQRQITAEPALGPADVIGAFDLPSTTIVGVTEPNWQTAYGLALLAYGGRPGGALHENGVAPVPMLLRGGLAARFLAQLMFAEPGCFYVRSTNDVLGGIRLSLWDNTVAVGPTAVSLWAAAEFQQTLAGQEAMVLR